MSSSLYNKDILRLAASIPFAERLPDPQASVEKRSPICGSRVTIDLDLDADGRVAAMGMVVRACALGQASAALLRGHVIGRDPSELTIGTEGLGAWLRGERAAPDWPGIEVLAPAIPHSARHASILLAFEAAAQAATQAAATAQAKAPG